MNDASCNEVRFNVHGSRDSIDVDVAVAVPSAEEDFWMSRSRKPHELVAECARYASPVAAILGCEVGKVNCNIVVVRGGVLVWVAKGDSSESNNALLATYSLHKQVCGPFATRKVERNINAKIHRAVRSALGCFTRTNYRIVVKVEVVFQLAANSFRPQWFQTTLGWLLNQDTLQIHINESYAETPIGCILTEKTSQGMFALDGCAARPAGCAALSGSLVSRVGTW
jgi:hypothetical protein